MALLIFVLFCGCLTLCQSVNSAVDSSNFCYDDKDVTACGPSNWPGRCQTGLNQSPINLPLTSRHLESAVKKEFFVKEWGRDIQALNITLKNTGHSVRLEIATYENSKFTLSGPLLKNKNYTFAYVDFHWGHFYENGSEHSLNGKRYAMEAQAVFYRSDFDSVTRALASQERQALTIFAMFYAISGRNNPALSYLNISTSLHKIQEAGSSTTISLFTSMYYVAYSPSRKDPVVIQYNGSLTTPDCNESVLWNVLNYIEPISLSQLREFKSLKDSRGKAYRGNNRPLQRANTRKIDYFHPRERLVRDDFQ